MPERKPFDAAAGLRAARQVAGLSQRELAAAAGVRQETLARIEAGEVRDPRVSTLERLLVAAGCALSVVDPAGGPLEPWEFEDALDRGRRHLPAHLPVREVREWRDWWGWLHYSTWAHPPTPSHTFSLRPREDDTG